MINIPYQVITKRRFWASVILVLVILCAVSVIVRETVQVGTVKRSLPIYSVATEEKRVAMGINCAWDNKDIPTIIQILDKYKMKATFFVVGDWVEKYPESVKMIYENGHEIGNHSTTHRDMTTLSREEIVRELQLTSNLVAAITGEPTKLLRPPSGAYNNLVVETARGVGYEVVQWDVDSIDIKRSAIKS